MSAKAYMIADLHLGHNKILSFEGHNRCGGNLIDLQDHDDWIIHQINSRVGKRDALYILGDAAFGKKPLQRLKELQCKSIHFILGNHDQERMHVYEEIGRVHSGLYKYKGAWLSHAPIHPDSLRGMDNIHGHIHSDIVKYQDGSPDLRYHCVSVEHCNGTPVAFESLI